MILPIFLIGIFKNIYVQPLHLFLSIALSNYHKLFPDKSWQFSLLKEGFYWYNKPLTSFCNNGISPVIALVIIKWSALVLLEVEFYVLNIGAGQYLFRHIHYESVCGMARDLYYISCQLVHVKFKCNNSSLLQWLIKSPSFTPPQSITHPPPNAYPWLISLIY